MRVLRACRRWPGDVIECCGENALIYVSLYGARLYAGKLATAAATELLQYQQKQLAAAVAAVGLRI